MATTTATVTTEITGFPHLLENSGKSWNFYWKISRTWKVLENDLGNGKSWKFLGSDVHAVFGFKWTCICRGK